jgi:hypothetical protein
MENSQGVDPGKGNRGKGSKQLMQPCGYTPVGFIRYFPAEKAGESPSIPKS